ncbi:MAG TPA: NAD(P)/FAD-dependent oxidoreductase, partial [Mycobacterium sp.]|nr:NAD(P)/FAD-dependent oxidoreductase [Mycobacterium sp.]
MSENGTGAEKSIVIVGGGLAATRTAEQLRKAEYAGPITIVSDEVHLPYDRPPLSKDVLHADLDDVALKPAEFYEDNNIALRLGSAATSLNTAARTLTLADGSVLSYDELVIATGLVPKRIPSFPDLEGIRVLRSLDEALALRAHAASARRAVIVGAGFIGCEVAASLRKLGVDVVLVEPQPAPLASVLGEQVGNLVARLHRAEGVDVRTGVGVAEVRGENGHVSTVVLSDGSELPADLVVVGIGSRPATDWLEGSGVEVDNGIICDEAGRTSAAGVWALGDVASWRDATGHQARVEHWSNVAEQARVLAPAILG